MGRLRSERDFRRFAQARLRSYFPRLVSQGQLNPRIRALEPEWRGAIREDRWSADAIEQLADRLWEKFAREGD